MSQAESFMKRLELLDEGERAQLRVLAGRPLDESLAAFDLFTGLWWPLRQRSAGAPRRETAWLVARLFGAFPLPRVQSSGTRLAAALARCEPREELSRKRFRRRFDALLESPLSGLEPHLRWALSVVDDAGKRGRPAGLDWAQLLEDLSIWDRADEHRRGVEVREAWAEQYLDAALYSIRS